MSQVPPATKRIALDMLGATRVRYWTLGCLAVVAFLATVDRQAFAVLLVPIQRDLGASDSAMGFLMGSSFALAQAIFTLPLAWLSDRTNRRNLLAIALAIWSIATALGGIAGTFAALLVCRLVVGAAEAAQTPATVSLVSDLFGSSRRGTAFMFCSVGTALGVAVGSYAGGVLSDLYSWNAALLVVGLPGLGVAALLYLTVPEPPRSLAKESGCDNGDHLSVLLLLRRCLAVRTIPPFIVGFAILQGAVLGWFIWFPVLLMRVHGLSASEMGAVFGTIVLCGVLSAIWAGPVSDVLARRGARWRLYFIVAVTLLSIPLLLLSSLTSGLMAAQACAMGFTLLLGGHHPAAVATYASLSPPAMRAFVSGLVHVSVLVVSAMAPAAFGFFSDTLAPAQQAQSLRYTLLLAPALLMVSAFFFWIASRTVDHDTAAAERATAPHPL